jgi:hypothetical protein
MDLRVLVWGGVEWVDPSQDRDQWRALMNTVMNVRVPLSFEKFLSNCTTSGLCMRAHLHDVISC